MIYLDTSVALAHLLAQDRASPDTPWTRTLASSRLREHELRTRVHARGLSRTHGPLVRELLGRIALVTLAPPVLARALEGVPGPVRTLGALHLWIAIAEA